MAHKLTTFVSGNYSLVSASDDKNILKGVEPIEVAHVTRLDLASGQVFNYTLPFSIKIVSIRQPLNTIAKSLSDGLFLFEGGYYTEGEILEFTNNSPTTATLSLYFKEVLLEA